MAVTNFNVLSHVGKILILQNKGISNPSDILLTKFFTTSISSNKKAP